MSRRGLPNDFKPQIDGAPQTKKRRKANANANNANAANSAANAGNTNTNSTTNAPNQNAPSIIPPTGQCHINNSLKYPTVALAQGVRMKRNTPNMKRQPIEMLIKSIRMLFLSLNRNTATNRSCSSSADEHIWRHNYCIESI